MRVGMYEVREQLVHLVEGRFSLTGRGRYWRIIPQSKKAHSSTSQGIRWRLAD
jgi:hypothetical protein